MEAFLNAAALALAPGAVAAVALGTAIGLLFGSIPGLTFTVSLALALPLTFGMEPVAAIGLLLGTYIGGMTGGSVTAILLGIPGTPSAAATTLDGYPMTRQDRGSLALGFAVIGSVIGGVFSMIVMVLSVDLIARVAISFGPAEIFALVVFGLSTICGLAAASMLKGMIAGVLGLMVMTIGLDMFDGVPRMTMGSTQMLQGVNMIVAMIGLFAMPFVIRVFQQHRSGTVPPNQVGRIRVRFPTPAMLWSHAGLFLRSSSIGTAVGAIPGTGGPIAAFLAYDNARRFARDKSKFGKGDERGVIAPETACNAVIGGCMIPLLALGIPGDPATALILAGMQIQGLVPGPALFMTNRVEVYGIYIAIVLSFLFLFFMQLACIRMFIHILRVPQQILAVVVVVLCTIGAYTFRNSVFDIYTVGVIGLLGYYLIRAGIPIAPIILGLVLGPTLEGSFRTAMTLSGGDTAIFYTSPTAIVFLLLAALIIGLQVVANWRRRGGGAEGPVPEPAESTR